MNLVKVQKNKNYKLKKSKMKALNIIHIIVTSLLLALVVWLVVAEAKRMKQNKEIAESSAPKVEVIPG